MTFSNFYVSFAFFVCFSPFLCVFPRPFFHFSSLCGVLSFLCGIIFFLCVIQPNPYETSIIGQVLEVVNSEIKNKLHEAKSVSLVTDIWTNRQMLDFIAVSANLTNEAFEKESLVIGMKRMAVSRCAENIKSAIEKIVNMFDFNKSKISGNFNLLFSKRGISH